MSEEIVNLAELRHLQMEVTDLKAENDRLKKIIAQTSSENDDLGSEYTHVCILKEKLDLAVEALEHEIKILEAGGFNGTAFGLKIVLQKIKGEDS